MGFILASLCTVCCSEKHVDTVRNLLKSEEYKELSFLESSELLILSPLLLKTFVYTYYK